MDEKNYPKSRDKYVVIQELKDEILIYDLVKNKAFCLNKTATLIWQNCNGQNSVKNISLIINQKHRLAIDESVVWLALDQLKQEDLLENDANIPKTFEGLSRREVLRKVGFASMVVLPLLTSVTAPKSAEAASVCGNLNDSCASNVNSCCAGLTCQNQVPGNPGTTCCVLFTPCTSDSQCCSALACITTLNVCFYKQNPGATCHKNSDCLSNNCVGVNCT